MMKPFESFKFNKAFGQNFISDKNLLNAIAKDSGISFNDNVLEIGTGAGTLTEVLASHAKKVVTFEIDKKLTEYLTEKFSSVDNVKLVLKDALTTPINEIEELFMGQDFHLVANLPYYITTPLIFKFLEETNKAKSITVMVQKEVAEKIVAKNGDKNYGITSVLFQYYFQPKIKRIVSKKMFSPQPKVDSAVITMQRKEDVPFDKAFSNFVRASFSMKRKTLINNLANSGYEKSKISACLEALGIEPAVRAENLPFATIRQIFEKLAK